MDGWSQLENFLEEGIKLALPFPGVSNLVDLSKRKLCSVSIERSLHQASDESAQIGFPVSIEAGLELYQHLPVDHLMCI
jgi:hypothetical protein